MKNRKSRFLVFSTFTILLCAVTLANKTTCFESVTSSVSDVLARKPLNSAHVGILAVDLRTKEVILNVNDHKLFVPASVMKLITTLSAWEYLGPEFRYETKIYIPKDSQPPLVVGDLVIKGSGDPSITIESLDSIALELKNRGFLKILGNIHIDNSAFGKSKWSFRWAWDLSDNPIVDAFIVQPFVRGFNPYNEAEPSIYFGRLLKGSFKKFGIEVTGEVKVGRRTLEGFDELITIYSPTLRELVKITNKLSHNSYAEQLARTVALKVYGLGSLENAQKFLSSFVTNVVGGNAEFRIADGCGLSTYNLLSPYTVVRLIDYAYEKYGGLEGFLSTLSVSGVDGTLASRLTQYMVYGKTGTLAHVSSLAGVAVTNQGKHVAFAIFINNFTGEAPRKDIDDIVQWICENF